MNAGSVPSVAALVARYLLFATVGILAIDAVIDVLSQSFSLWLALLVVAALSMASVGRYATRRGQGRSNGHRVGEAVLDRRWVLLALFGLVVVGAGLRVYALGAQSFWFDEAITANAAIALLERGTPTFPSGYTYWRAFPHTLAVAGSMALFGTGEAAARLPSVVFGAGTIVATYWLGRDVGGPIVGVVAATLVTFATWEIAWSRQARMYQLFQLLYTLSLVLLLRVERRWFADRGEVAALAVVVALAAWTHEIGYVLLPVVAVYVGLTATLDGRVSPRAIGGVAVGLLGFLVADRVIDTGVGEVIGRASPSAADYLGAYTDWLIAELDAVFFLGLIGVALTFYGERYRPGLLLVLAIAPATWVLSFHTDLFATRYLYFGLPVLFVWAAVTAAYVGGVAVDRFRSVLGEGSRSLVNGLPWGSLGANASLAAAFGLLVVVGLGGGLTVTPQAEYDLGPNAPQPDFDGAYRYVNEYREPGDVIVAGWTAPGLYYAGGVDYWLAHDLAGLDYRWTNDSGERYSGATPVRSADALARVMASHRRGWIVLDTIAYSRQSPETQTLLAENATLRYDRGGITVYHWRSNSSTDGGAT